MLGAGELRVISVNSKWNNNLHKFIKTKEKKGKKKV